MFRHLRALSSIASRRTAGVPKTVKLKDPINSPDAFNGVYTKYGWFLVPKTHLTRVWTQSEVVKAIEAKDLQDSGYQAQQEVVDEWAENVDLKEKPKSVPRTAEQVRTEENIFLFRQQIKEEQHPEAPPGVERKRRITRNMNSSTITYTHAWNYFVTVMYPKFKDMTWKESRLQISQIWRQMSLEEKDNYREEYAELLHQGKDIHRGKIIDRAEKVKILEKQSAAKDRLYAKKMKELEKYQSMLETKSTEGIEQAEKEK